MAGDLLLRDAGQNTSRRPGRNARSQRQQSLTYSNDPPSYDVVQGVAPPKYDTLPGMSNPVLDTRVSLTSASSGDIPPPSYEKAVEEPGESTWHECSYVINWISRSSKRTPSNIGDEKMNVGLRCLASLLFPQISLLYLTRHCLWTWYFPPHLGMVSPSSASCTSKIVRWKTKCAAHWFKCMPVEYNTRTNVGDAKLEKSNKHTETFCQTFQDLYSVFEILRVFF